VETMGSFLQEFYF